MRLMHRRVPALVILSVSALSVFGFAAANVVPESGAGDGANTVSGYTVSSVVYTPNATDPTKIDFWTMNINPTAGATAPTKVYSKVNASATTYVTCALNTAPNWKCDPAAASEPTVLSADNLRVIATQ